MAITIPPKTTGKSQAKPAPEKPSEATRLLFPESNSPPAKPSRKKRFASAYDPSDPDTPPPLLISDFSVVVDTREQAPYRFTGILDDKTCQEIIVHLEHYALKSGDYSIVGLEDVVAVERKSLQDFYGSISSGRERFQREIERLDATYRYALVVIEGDWEDIMHPESFTQVTAKTAIRTIQSWEVRYPTVHWKWLPNRRVSEVYTYRQLEMFHRIWKHEQEDIEKAAKAAEGVQSIGEILKGITFKK